MGDYSMEAKLEDIKVLLGILIDKTNETNRILKDGIQTNWGHKMSVLEMDPDRFKKNEGKAKHF